MFAYVPARGGSKRIPRKNVRPLGGKPLLERVIEQLRLTPGLAGVAVSSEDSEILALAEKAGATTLCPRDAALADDTTGFMDLVRRDAPRFSAHFCDDDVLFVTATAALVTSASYSEALARHKGNESGLTMAVTVFDRSPMLALTGDPRLSLAALFPEMYLKPTKDLPPCCFDAGCFYAFSIERASKRKKLIDLTPIRGVVLPNDVGIDLDTEADWHRLEESFARRARD